MNKIVLIVGVCLLIISASMVIINNESEEVKTMEEKSFQGPVRPTDDEAYFRETGITRPKEVKE